MNSPFFGWAMADLTWSTENEAVCFTQHKCSHVAGCYKHDVDQKFSDNRDLVH